MNKKQTMMMVAMMTVAVTAQTAPALVDTTMKAMQVLEWKQRAPGVWSAMIGKAERGPTAIEAIRKHKSAYLMAVGGAAYLVSKAIKTAKVVGFADLGMEAIYEFDVTDMPVTVAVDAGGTSVHNTGPAEWQKKIATGEFKNIAIAPA